MSLNDDVNTALIQKLFSQLRPGIQVTERRNVSQQLLRHAAGFVRRQRHWHITDLPERRSAWSGLQIPPLRQQGIKFP